MNKFFTSVGNGIHDKLLSSNDDDFLEFMPDNSSLEGIEVFNEVTEEAVLEYVGSIANDKSIYDNIPVKVYKYIIPSIITPLTHIINNSLSSGVMPESCKRALVTPIYKREGDKLDPGNYRPISILSLLGECTEYLDNQNLMEYITDNNIISDRQFGFRKDNSTTYLMLELFYKIYSAKERGISKKYLILLIMIYSLKS